MEPEKKVDQYILVECNGLKTLVHKDVIAKANIEVNGNVLKMYNHQTFFDLIAFNTSYLNILSAKKRHFNFFNISEN